MSQETIDEVVNTETEILDEAAQGSEQIDDDADTAGADEADTEEKKIPQDAPEWARQTISRLRAQRREAREKATAAEESLQQAKAEADKLNAKFGDRDVLAAAKRVGFAAELMSADEVKLVDRAETLESRLERLEDTLEDHPDGYEDGDGKTVTPTMLHQWLRKTRRELKEIEDDAAGLRKQKAGEAREIWKLGQAALKEGWKPGQKPAATKSAPVKKVQIASTDTSTATSAHRRPVTQATAKTGADFSKVKTRDELVAEMAKDYGG